jgi:hypothetical protein
MWMATISFGIIGDNMSFCSLVYDEHGRPLYGIEVTSQVTCERIQHILDLYIRDRGIDNFDIDKFVKYVNHFKAIPCRRFTFDRLNLREVHDARLE